MSLIYDLEGLIDLEECGCGRPWCSYFAAGVGEFGESFSRRDLRRLHTITKRVEKNLAELLKKPTKRKPTYTQYSKAMSKRWKELGFDKLEKGLLK